jgi:hypothetical protein
MKGLGLQVGNESPSCVAARAGSLNNKVFQS